MEGLPTQLANGKIYTANSNTHRMLPGNLIWNVIASVDISFQFTLRMNSSMPPPSGSEVEYW